jgi:hypothetical protein
MKKRRSWKFSQGGGALFLLFLFAPFLERSVSLLLQDGSSIPMKLVALACLVLLSLLLWFLSVRPLISAKLWCIPRSWYEASFALSAVFLFYAVFIFVTGYTPTKYASHAVPRDTGLYWLYAAGLPFLIGLAAYVYEKRKAA